MNYYNRGFFQLILILVLLVVILSLLGVSLSSLFENKTLQENFAFVGKGLTAVWEKALKTPVLGVWDALWGGIIREFIWEPAKDFFFSLKAGENLFSK